MRELSLNNCRLDRRYDTRDHLGRGSYAEIFLAADTLASPQSPHHQVVIKALNVILQNDLDPELERTLIENFQNEAIALDRVRHPNIISRLGHGTARDLRGTTFHYLVLEYLSGGDMQSLLRKQKLPIQRSLDHIEQICAGLGHAHKKGVIHRDIKPQNLLLTADHLTVKIADFGVARISASDSPITRVGTNIYAPPEHSPLSVGRTGELDVEKLTPAADIYSLAKTVYTILTGEPPRAFANETIVSLPESAMTEEWAEDLLRVLRKATDRDPARRHQNVEDLWSDLSGVRQIVADAEYITQVSSHVRPQPHVSRGYNPIAPQLPQFEAIPAESNVSAAPAYVHPGVSAAAAAPTQAPGRFVSPAKKEVVPVPTAVPQKQKRTRFRRFVAFLLILTIFTGILYGTASYMRGKTFLPEIRNPFRAQTGVANTDVYLRPTPNTDNDPIGLVTKNSKVRIVNSQNNWYQVDIVEQGRERNSAPNATRGWLNGKYLEIGDN